MPVIHSRQHPLVREWVALGRSPRQCRKLGRTILDGVHLAQAYQGPVRAVLVSQSGTTHSEIAPLLANKPWPEACLLEDTLFASCASVKSPAGIALLVDIPDAPLPEKLSGACLWLERIQDPGNLGTLMRSAAGAGVHRVLLSSGCAQAWSPKVLRAGMGAHFTLTVHEDVPLSWLSVHYAGRILAATLTMPSTPYHQEDLRGDVAFVVGNEGSGLSPESLALAHGRVYIPMEAGMESINAAVAGSILLFERHRQLMSMS